MLFRSAFSPRPALIAAFLCATALLGPMTPAVAAKATPGNAAAPTAQQHPAAAPVPPPVSSCAKPPAPQCMDDGVTFAAPDKMTGCQSEVKDYVDRTMSYLKCLNDENIAAGRDLTRNVERFNCRLSGRKGCP